MTTLEEYSGGEEDETIKNVPVELASSETNGKADAKPVLEPKNLRAMFAARNPGVTWDDKLHKEKALAEWRVIAEAHNAVMAKWKEAHPEQAKTKRPKKKKKDGKKKKDAVSSDEDEAEVVPVPAAKRHHRADKGLCREVEMIHRDLAVSVERLGMVMEKLEDHN